MMKASLHSALVLGLAIGCSHSGDALFDSSGVPMEAPRGGSGNAASGGSTGAVGATPDPGPQGGKASGGNTSVGGAGKPADAGNGGDDSPPGPSEGGAGSDAGAGGNPEQPNPPDEPQCGNGVLEAGEECDDAGEAGQDGCEACQVVCSHFGQGTLESADHHCYNGYDEDDFQGAVAACKARGAHLVTISSGEENQIVRMLVNTSKFIGGLEDVALNQKGQGDYAWITGEAMTYENWADPEPNRADSRCGNTGAGSIGSGERCYEHCMAMNGMGKWEDRRCDQEDGYVCEWEPAGQ